MKSTAFAIATLAVVACFVTPAEAFPGNSSEDFFEEGQEQFEREIQNIAEKEPLKRPLLDIDESLLPEWVESRPIRETETEEEVEQRRPTSDFDFRQFNF